MRPSQPQATRRKTEGGQGGGRQESGKEMEDNKEWKDDKEEEDRVKIHGVGRKR